MLSNTAAFANLFILNASSSVEALAEAALDANVRNGQISTSGNVECFKQIVLLRDAAAEAEQTYALGLLRRLNAALVTATDRYAVTVSFGNTEEMGIGVRSTERGSNIVVFDSSTSTNPSTIRY